MNMTIALVMKKIRRKVDTLLRFAWHVEAIVDEIKINQGLILSELNKSKRSRDLRDYEFKVFSQWGDDGLIQKLIDTIEIENKTFIEFGVQDFYESNCRFLMTKDNWAGFVIDGSASNIRRLKASHFYWRHALEAIAAFLSRANINEILARSKFDHDLGLLSIDIDGVDYFVLEAIDYYKPRILIVEFNAIFGPERKITVPYDERFCRTDKHHSNLYFGASLSALTHLANKKGYELVGINSACVNAFFVRKDLVNEKLQVLTPEQAYTPSAFRESRDSRGNASYLSGDARLAAIKGLPVTNVETGASETV